jgi:hypothetical protein
LGSVAAVVVVVGTGGAVIWGYLEGRDEAAIEAERERPVVEPLRVSMRNGAPVITLDRETRQKSGIETMPLVPAPFQEEVRAYGTVLDLARLTDRSNSYITANAQVQTTQARLAASAVAFDSAQSRIKSQLETSASLAQAKATFLADQAAVAAAESQVRTLSATAYQEWGPVLGKSFVERSETITRLIERQDFLLQVTLPPGTTMPRPPAEAAIETGKATHAAIAFVSLATRTDPKIQSVSFFYTAPAESGVLPGMNVLAHLPTGTTVDGVRVPEAAIVWWQDRAWVYRRTDDNTFARIEIATELPAPGGRFAVKDLPHNAEIVTRGAQLLLSEEFRAQIQVGEEQK